MDNEEIVEKHKQEAINQGFEYIGKSPSGNPNYRQYKCKQGHVSDFQVQHMRRKSCTCKICHEENLIKEAESIGYKLLSKSELGPDFRLYQKDCGCIENVRTGSVRKTKDKRSTGQTTCKTCYRNSLQKYAEESDITLFEDIDTYYIKIKFNKCGHFKEALKMQIPRKNLVCRVCQEEQFKNEAVEQGIELLGAGKGSYRTYKLPCGCIRELRPSHVRESRWECDVCEDSHFVKPSIVYLLKMKATDGKEWLKLGYSRDVKSRISGYGFKGSVETLKVLHFSTGKESMAFEKSIHKQFRDKLIPKSVMKSYMANGSTECYELDMLDNLLSALNEEV